MYQIDFNHPVHVHFVGIGGISMSGLAQILASEGFTVSGSDRAASEITRTLENSGIRVMIGQRRENITKDIDLAVFTAAIHPDNPEYKAVQELKIPALTRAELLGQLMRNYRLPVAVSGTHGKTTTTSMLSEILTPPCLSEGSCRLSGAMSGSAAGLILLQKPANIPTASCRCTPCWASSLI